MASICHFISNPSFISSTDCKMLSASSFTNSVSITVPLTMDDITSLCISPAQAHNIIYPITILLSLLVISTLQVFSICQYLLKSISTAINEAVFFSWLYNIHGTNALLLYPLYAFLIIAVLYWLLLSFNFSFLFLADILGT